MLEFIHSLHFLLGYYLLFGLRREIAINNNGMRGLQGASGPWRFVAEVADFWSDSMQFNIGLYFIFMLD